ncbi:MAG: hypothetical protein FK733_09160 [Asgard group archaeon]|nr:hypothetical protein [Asgard group archaeon]
MVKLEKVGFISALLGGLLGVVSGILGLVNVLPILQNWYLGGRGLLGWLIDPTGLSIVWPIIFLVLCGIALIIGVLKGFFELLEFDLIIWAILLIIIGALVWGIPGWLILVGGILVLVGKFME